MKPQIMTAVLAATLYTTALVAQEKEFKETLTRQLALEGEPSGANLIVRNITGNITIEGYEGNSIQVEVYKVINARDNTRLEQGKEEIGLKVETLGNDYILYPDAPNLVYKDGHLNSADCQNYEAPPYDYRLDFSIKVPDHMKVDAGTVNDGELVISNLNGDFIRAVNVNGGVALNQISGQTEVHCINGKVNISYKENPSGPSTYYSLNGDINIDYQKDLSAEIGFKSMNGELFTDFDISRQFSKSSKEITDERNSPRYKYESIAVVQIGDGAFFHEFETLNGNVVIKKM